MQTQGGPPWPAEFPVSGNLSIMSTVVPGVPVIDHIETFRIRKLSVMKTEVVAEVAMIPSEEQSWAAVRVWTEALAVTSYL